MYVLRSEKFHEEHKELPCYKWLDLYLYQSEVKGTKMVFSNKAFETPKQEDYPKPNFFKVSDFLGFPNEDFPMYALTTEDGNNGAVIATNPIVLETIGAAFGGDFFLLPSSVHEFLVVPRDDEMIEDLLQAIRDINREVLSEEEFLSDSLYMYDVEKKSIKVFHK